MCRLLLCWLGLIVAALLAHVVPALARSCDADVPNSGGVVRHAIAMHGEPLLAADFANFPFVNPQAPSSGRLTQGVLGSFDSLNPFIVKGLPVQEVRGHVVESLLTRGYDEPFTLYGLLARCVETDAERSYVTFTLDQNARFSNGAPVTAEDVVFSYQLLRDKGRPNYRTYYSKVTSADVLDTFQVRFRFDRGADRELPLILGLMPIIAKDATDPNTFDQTSFRAPVGSGPYTVAHVDPGARVTLRKNPNYWGRDLPVTRGFWNFDEIRLDYYRDATTHFEAFKTNQYDVRGETDPTRWYRGYPAGAVRQGRLIKEQFKSGLPKGMNALVLNSRRPHLSDIRVREALGLLFDFEWVNRTLYFGSYRRTDSYFAASELASTGRPADARERELLNAFRSAVREDILEGQSTLGASDGSGRDRDRMRRALDLLASAGWTLARTQLRDRSGRPFRLELLATTKDQERLALAYARDLKRVGITLGIRVVDATQYERRRQNFDFDMMQYHWGESLSPGNEQAFYWGSAAADQPGTRNYMGVKSEAADAMIAAMLSANDRTSFVSAVRALDRVLLSGFYVVPLFYQPEQWVVRSSYIGRPAQTSLYGYLTETWWREPQQP
ncbi:MAG: peptide/nickel transport system substrate-binding protein [Variibacter sp.]|nr:peptide/nickel transport system substrate-binding protein [Variibacter sp.]